MKTACLAIGCAWILACSAAGAGRGATLSVQEPWSNVYAGRHQEFHLRVTSEETISGRIVWQILAGSAVLARGEKAVSDRDAVVLIEAEVPPLKPGASLNGLISAAFLPDGARAEQGRMERKLWYFSDSPFGELDALTRRLKIRLFDSEGKTRAVFDKAPIAYEPLDNVDQADVLTNGLLVIGEGVSVRDYKGLPAAAAKAARAGVNVLVLASAERGEWPIPLGTTDHEADFQSVTFRREEVITDLDKRLDARGWAPDGRSLASALAVAGDRGGVAGEFRAEGEGWAWVEMKAPGGGRVILCGFAMIRKWDQSPTPVYLLVRLFQDLDKQKNDR